MRQINVCINKVFKFSLNLKLNYYPEAHANSGAHEKCAMKINERKTKNDGHFIRVD